LSLGSKRPRWLRFLGWKLALIVGKGLDGGVKDGKDGTGSKLKAGRSG